MSLGCSSCESSGHIGARADMGTLHGSIKHCFPMHGDLPDCVLHMHARSNMHFNHSRSICQPQHCPGLIRG